MLIAARGPQVPQTCILKRSWIALARRWSIGLLCRLDFFSKPKPGKVRVPKHPKQNLRQEAFLTRRTFGLIQFGFIVYTTILLQAPSKRSHAPRAQLRGHADAAGGCRCRELLHRCEGDEVGSAVWRAMEDLGGNRKHLIPPIKPTSRPGPSP